MLGSDEIESKTHTREKKSADFPFLTTDFHFPSDS